MPEPVPIAQVIDNELMALLGPAGFDSYSILIRQTHANRNRIIADTRQLALDLFQGELARLMQTFPGVSPESLQLNARLAAVRSADRERDRLLAEEQRLFTERCNRLFAWVEERKRPGCEGCGE